MCVEGYYCDGLSCDHCRPVSVCPTGSGVSTPSNGRMDTICKPCPEGKYNNVVDSKTPCLTHTECEVLGRPGTEDSDAVCAREQSCHWVLPACLWAGLVLTLLIIGFGYFFWRKKHRSKKTVTKHEMPMNDVTLKLPNLIPEGYNESCNGESHALCCNRQPCDSNFPSTVMFSSCQVEVHHPMKSVDLECDGPGTPTITSSEHFDQSAARRGEAQSFTPSPCQSQPQEDEWSGT
ncbi:hypothetical protein SKAU_G00225250 [Synaphobranchus kaupii]|uniref:TNFR-Cys domain-containing protein n=1 Tax=Synaphobranchus kaupii TaxID=118154 RepID=A0A9Q1FC46_SYNKA|nr:hypothetical protein SKAU_G00225250 [Synaphobranchus kaupii]